MTYITVDQSLREKLKNLEERIEFRDENGRVLGYYAPANGHDHSLYKNVEIPFTEEEIEQLRKQPRGRPLADILPDLEKRQ